MEQRRYMDGMGFFEPCAERLMQMEHSQTHFAAHPQFAGCSCGKPERTARGHVPELFAYGRLDR